MVNFIFGMIIGACIGMFGAAILMASSRSDEHAEEMRKKEGLE